MSALFPDVPNTPGVPAVLRDVGNLGTDTLTELTGDALDPFSIGDPQWGIFDDGGSLVLDPDSIIAVEDTADRRVSTYPIEQGGFESYNKVAVPFEAHVIMTKGGTIDEKSQFIDKVKELTDSLKLYSIVTPEETFEKVNFVHHDKSRMSYKGATMLTISIGFIEIRESAQAAFTNSKEPSGAATVNDGPVQPKDPPAGLKALSTQESNVAGL